MKYTLCREDGSVVGEVEGDYEILPIDSNRLMDALEGNREFVVQTERKPNTLILRSAWAEGEHDGTKFEVTHTFGLGGASLILKVDGHDQEVMDLRPVVEAWVKEVAGSE